MRRVRDGARRSSRMSGRRAVVAGVTSLLGLMLATTPGMAADSGTVDAQVTISQSAACIELSVAAISFGTLALGAENVSGSPTISVSNCADADATVLASGTSATGINATWNLVDSAATCANTLGLDNYHLGLATTAASVTTLSTSNKQVATLAAAASIDHVARIWTACPGSSGAGETMSMQISYLATSATQGVDADGDGFPVPFDCNDTDAAIYPGAPEVLNGLDDNCNGVIDEISDVDADGDGVTVAAGDCDDANAAVHPGAIEIVDGLDNDCDGLLGSWTAYDGPVGTEGVGTCQAGTQFEMPDGSLSPIVGQVTPVPEVPLNGLDDDCDGVVDEA